MSSNLLDKGYEPHDVEKRWYDFWEKERLFSASESESTQKCYSIVIPPPNVTGVLHMGHALNNTLQDMASLFFTDFGQFELNAKVTDRLKEESLRLHLLEMTYLWGIANPADRPH